MLQTIYIFDNSKFKVYKRPIKKLVKFLSDELNFQVLSLEISFIDRKQMLELNKKFFYHDYDTDIITLNYSEDIKSIDTEIFISYEMAIQNAKKFRVSTNSEIIRLIIHGILHLTGYDDTTEEERKKMKRVENRLTKKFSYLEIVK